MQASKTDSNHDRKGKDNRLMSLRKLGISVIGVAGTLLLTAGVVHAATNTDTGDHFTNAGATVTGNLKSGTTMTFNGTIDGLPVTVTCTTFTGSGKVPSTGLTVSLAAPKISGCTDSLGGTDTVKTTGTWKLTEVDAANDETATEPNTDKVKLTVPKAGGSFSSSIVNGCTVTAAPTGPASITGSYNDKGTDTVKNASIPVSGSGCAASTSAVTATVVLSPGVSDAS
jgi:hypothetical protein